MDEILQSEYSRVFEEIKLPTMSPSMYKTLENTKLRTAWEAISTEIIPELISGGYYVVPYPEEARDYDLFNVFVKIYECCCSRLLKKGRKYRYASRLQNVVRRTENDIFTYCDDEAFGIPKDYIFQSIERKRTGEEEDKTMLFIIRGTSKLCGELDHVRQNELVISRTNPVLGKATCVYVVNEVIVADSMLIQVSIGEKKRRWEFNGPIPLAFKFVKLRLRPSGHLYGVRPSDVLPRWNDTEPVEWERPSETKHKYFK